MSKSKVKAFLARAYQRNSGARGNSLFRGPYLEIFLSHHYLYQKTFQIIIFYFENLGAPLIPQFCIAHFYCAYRITYNFIHYTYRLLKKSFYDNFMLLQNIFGYIRAKNYVKINVFKKGIQKCS
jgi:hypothetical protein